jgi:hypothetical protein
VCIVAYLRALFWVLKILRFFEFFPLSKCKCDSILLKISRGEEAKKRGAEFTRTHTRKRYFTKDFLQIHSLRLYSSRARGTELLRSRRPLVQNSIFASPSGWYGYRRGGTVRVRGFSSGGAPILQPEESDGALAVSRSEKKKRSE